MTPLWSMRFLTTFKGQYVGEDAAGNRYYQEKFLFYKPSYRRPRRWVMYKGFPEASRIPPEWYAWIHFTSERPLTFQKRHTWQAPYVPNMTGTKQAYRPPASLAQAHPTTLPQDYEPWQPK